MKVRLPKRSNHTHTALEHKHERDVVDAMQGKKFFWTERRPFDNAIGQGLQTEILCAGDVTVVRTYRDLKCEIISASAEK